MATDCARAATYVEVARAHALERPDRLAFTFLDDTGAESARLTFGDVDRRARAVAAHLQRERARGERVLLLYDAGLEFIVGFLGCLYAGAIAVPSYPPGHRESRVERLQRIVADCEAALALSTRDVIRRHASRSILDGVDRCPHLFASDALPVELADDWEPPCLSRDDIAFLQYTSGSSATPVGVRVTHANLLANQLAIQRGFEHGPETVFVGWLPLFHDMGLVGNVLQPLYLGIPSFLLSPYTVLRSPIEWLRAITRYRATTSGGPNFGYEMCVRDIRDVDRAGLDLRSWSVAFNGAEPIFAQTLDSFAEAFEPFGFRREAFLPCYGMAETTLLATCGKPGRPYVTTSANRDKLEQGEVCPPTDANQAVTTLVGCGRAQDGLTIDIVGPDSQSVPEGRVGEIWISGTSVSTGYWRPALRGTAFRRRRHNDDTEWLQTGDLGFRLNDELFVAGRCSDLIIVRGRNYHPQDLERTAWMTHPALQPHGCAAFQITEAARSRVVLVSEVRRSAIRSASLGDVPDAIIRAVAEQHGVALHDVVLVRPNNVRRTSSGKVARTATRSDYLAGRLAIACPPSPPSDRTVPTGGPAALRNRDKSLELADGILQAVSSSTGRSFTSAMRDRSLIDVGADSLAIVATQRYLERTLGTTVSFRSLMSDRTIVDITRELMEAAPRKLAARSPLERTARTEGPASDYQRALWLAQQLDPGSNAYNVCVSLEFPIDIPVTVADSAVRMLLARHPSLLTAFRAKRPDGEGFELTQHVVAPGRLPLDVVDARGWSAPELRRSHERLVEQPFDLEAGDTFRASLYTTDHRRSLIVLSAHHLVVDAPSMALLVEDLGAILKATFDGCAAAARPAAPSAIDYATWQRERVLGEYGERLRVYWRETLASASTPADPAVNGLPDDARDGDALHELDIAMPLVARVEALARAKGCTLCTIYLAALQCVIHRYTEARDVIVAMPVTVRPDGASSTIGYTINVLPVRVVCEGNPSFADFADRVRVALTGALEHRELPLTDILAEWRRNQPLTSAAAPVMLVWQSHEHLLPSGAPLADDSLLDFGGIRATVTRLPSPRAQCDVVLSLAPSASGGISGRLHFDRRKWRADTISRLAGHFVTLLEDGVENPHRHIRQLALLTPPELSARRHPTTARTPPLVMERFEAQVQRTPDRVAVVCGADRLSYAMLASRIDALAHALRARGMGSGRAVGVCLPRSVDLVVALLGIWKARGVYVPLDPTVPTPRLVRYVRDAACEVVLSSADHMASAESDFGVPALGVAAHDSAVDSLATLDMGSPDDPAYVVFTSGSTGEPKGVEIEQRAVAALFDWAISHYEPDDLAGMLASTSISFDISLFELVTPLLAGGTVVVADSILSLPRLSYALTLINTVPSAARALLEADAFPSTTRTLNLAGEHLPQRLVDALYARTTIRRIYDLYGPTEDTVFSTAALRVPGGIDTIGTPIAGSRTYVVDAHLEPVPVGVPGELLLGGVKLARGYVRRPDLTADAFLTDLAANADAPRLYRTGDLARQLPDGRLQYLGRRDQQVKIRGFRIEPSEIEAQLARLPQVRRAAVVARASGDGEKRLVAYIVPAAGTDLDVEPLRAALAAQLPDYLMPSAFVMIRELPLNTNGKLDRSRLPEADRPEPRLCVAPRTPTEYRIHKLWESILPPSSFGVTDSFFSLGGDSLRVLRLHAGLNREFKVQIAPALLMSLPTIAALAASLDLVRTEPAVDAPEIIV